MAVLPLPPAKKTVVIVVVDDGVRVTHRDLRDFIWRNAGEVAGNAIDKVIRIDFTEFDTEPKIDCVYFFDGEDTHERIMAIYSGPNVPPPVTTWRNKVLVWFVTDGKNEGKG